MARQRWIITIGILLTALAAPVFGQEESGDGTLPYQEDIDYDHDGDVDQGDLAKAG